MTTEKTNYKWAIAPTLTVLAFIGGFIAQWSMMTTSVGYVQAAQVKLEERVAEAEKKVQEIEVNAAARDNDIKTIKDDVSEIKKDVKEILKRNK